MSNAPNAHENFSDPRLTIYPSPGAPDSRHSIEDLLFAASRSRRQLLLSIRYGISIVNHFSLCGMEISTDIFRAQSGPFERWVCQTGAPYVSDQPSFAERCRRG